MLTDTLYELIGYCTCQSHRVYPSPRSVLPRNLPFETSTRSLGIATLSFMFSGSSRHWSLLGHQMLEPSPSQAVLIQCLPVGSFLKAIPPNRPVSRGVPEDRK